MFQIGNKLIEQFSSFNSQLCAIKQISWQRATTNGFHFSPPQPDLDRVAKFL